MTRGKTFKKTGTGLIGDGIRKHGYKGFMDGLDGSLEMMVKAKEKGEYRCVLKRIACT